MARSLSDSSQPLRRRVLVVLRHGKAEAYSHDDHRRQLTERGRREAAAAGAWVAGLGHQPTHAIVSSAVRTRQTWDVFAHTAGGSPVVEVDDAAYGADSDGALELLRRAPADAEVLVLVGHNPTVSSLVHLLDDGQPDPAAFRLLSFGLPTSGVAVLDVPVEWAELELGTTRLVAGHTP